MKLSRWLAVAALVAAMPFSTASAQEQTEFPYITTITQDGVNTRSGPGKWWYVTGKLKKGDRVTVVGSQFGWAEIKPPVGQASLVRKIEVTADPDGRTGVIKTDAPVMVRAAPSGEKRFNRVQTVLAAGSAELKVNILGEWAGYYMIAPPEGATVFIASTYLAERGAVPAPQNIADTHVAPPVQTTRPEATAAVRPANTGTRTAESSPQRQRISELKAIVMSHQKLLADELAKPVAQRDYAALKTKFETLRTTADTQKSEELKQYAIAVIDYLDQQMALQKPPTAERSRIDEIVRESERIASGQTVKVEPDMYRAAGVLRKSAALGDSKVMPGTYRLETADGKKTICYVRGSGEMDLAALVGRPVAVSGKREYRGEWNLYVVTADKVEPTDSIGPAAGGSGQNTGDTGPGKVIEPVPPVPPVFDDSPFAPPIEEMPEMGPTSRPDSAAPRKTEPDVITPEPGLAPAPAPLPELVPTR